MTTTVKRGAGRPAATARTNRHAQRTVLPPKEGQRGNFAAVMELAKDQCPKTGCLRPAGHKGRHGQPNSSDVKSGLPEDRKRIRRAAEDAAEAEAGVNVTCFNNGHGGIHVHKTGCRDIKQQQEPGASVWKLQVASLREIVADTYGNGDFEDWDEGRRWGDWLSEFDVASCIRLPNEVPSSTVDAPAEGAKSIAKAEKFRTVIEAHGWMAEMRTEGDMTEVTATRGAETLHQCWIDGVWQYAASTYVIGDRPVKARNASQAKQWALRAPGAAEAEFARVSANKSFRRREVEPKRGRLPFDPALATDVEVIDALLGKQVSWHNRFTQAPETAWIGSEPKRVEIVEAPDGQRVVKFCCRESGFRAFRLSALLAVGGGRRSHYRAKAGKMVDAEELANAA